MPLAAFRPAFATLSPAGLTQVSGELGTGSQQATFNAMNQFLWLMTIRSSPDAAAASVATPARSHSPMRSRQRLCREEAARASATPMPNSRPRRMSRATICSIRAGASGAPPSAAAQHRRQCRAGIEQRDRARVRLRGRRRLSDFADTMAGFALAGGGTNFSVPTAWAAAVRICSRPAPSCATPSARPMSPARWPMAGRT